MAATTGKMVQEIIAVQQGVDYQNSGLSDNDSVKNNLQNKQDSAPGAGELSFEVGSRCTAEYIRKN